MIITIGIEFVNIIKTFRYLVISLHTLGTHGTALHTNLVGLKQFELFFSTAFYPYFQLSVVFKRTDIHSLRRPGKFFLFKLFDHRIFHAAKNTRKLNGTFLYVNK